MKPGDVPLIDQTEAQGVTPGEFRMIQEVMQWVDRNTVSQTFAGASEKGGKVTATQIIELQRQARQMMGLLELSAALLEKKLDVRLLVVLLKNWFDPIDEIADEARKVVKDIYRIVSRQRYIDGRGNGMRMVIPTKEIPDSNMIKAMEEAMEKRTGVPTRMILINPDEMKIAKLTWIVNVIPKEKKSSEYTKLLFDEMIARASALGLPLNVSYVAERFAQIWEEDPAKLFQLGGVGQGQIPGVLGAPVQAGATPEPRKVASTIPAPKPQQTAMAR